MAALVIGICGGTGAGKTTLARGIISAVSEDNAVLMQQDDYYKDLGNLTPQERVRQNFDHPDSLDMALMIEHLRLLRSGKSIDQPVYDFSRHARQQQLVRLYPRPVVIVEGTLIFENKALCELMEIKVFVDTEADVRFIRRLRRDIHERGRTVDSVIEQYLATVRPMHMQFVEPFKRHADVIIPYSSSDDAGIDVLIREIRSRAALTHSTLVRPQASSPEELQLPG